MLEGLEISEVMLSKAINVSNYYRWDSEYYLKEYIHNENILNKLKTIKFIERTNFIKKGIFDLPPSNYKEIGVPLIRTSEIKNPTIKFDTTVFINDETNKKNKKTILFPNDLVFTKIGAYIGDVAKLPNNYPEYNFSQNVTGINLKRKEEGSILLSFFLSKIGRKQILRSIMLSGQGKLELEDIRSYKIPVFSKSFEKIINNIFISKENIFNQSKQSYTQAETLLLEEIGLQDFTPSKEPVNIKRFKDSFGTSGRLDAEYYQLKYEQVVNKVKSKPYDVLSNIVDIKKSIEPGSKNYVEKGLPFMRVADLSKNGLSEPQKFISEHFVQANKDKIRDLKPKKGTILFSKDGTVGIAYHLRQDYKGITSGAILHLNVKDENRIIPEYLTLALNSKIVQMQAERDAGGSIILHWRSSEIENVVVPIIDYDKQQQIANLIEESFALKKQSEHLLEVAKKAVEIAIEENEEVALNYIKENE